MNNYDFIIIGSGIIGASVAYHLILNNPKSNDIKVIVIFAWNFFHEIKKKITSLSKKIISIKDLEKF